MLPLGYKHTKKTKLKISLANRGKTPWIKGKHHSKKTKRKIRLSKIGKNNSMFGKHLTEEHKRKIGDANQGEKSSAWRGGITKNKKYRAEHLKIWRHKSGISKKYRLLYTGISKTRKYKKLQRQKRKAFMKGGGELSIKRIQQVYENNIKQYGTLTCYLCLRPIEFGKDHLEHKTPLSRGGTNIKTNLAIACQECNCRKHIKTEEEFKKELLNV